MNDEWVMVPKYPTCAMVVRGAEILHDGGIRFETDDSEPQQDLAADAYRAMLDAAPAAPQQAEPAISVNVIQASDGSWVLQTPEYFPRLSAGWHDLYLHPPAAEVQRLRAALAGLLEHYVSLVDSGDAGTWDAEKEPEVIAARRALATIFKRKA